MNFFLNSEIDFARYLGANRDAAVLVSNQVGPGR
jgi:hypothetical protein